MTMKTIGMSALLVCSLVASATAAPAPPPQTTQAGTTLTGKVSTKGGKFFLFDQATQKSVEVRGTNLMKWVGKHARVVGEVAQGTVVAPEVLVISEITQLAGAAVATAGGTAAAAGVKGGISTIAVVGGGAGATAATVGTLVATDVIGGEEEPASRP